MGCFTTRYYDQVRDYLLPELHSFINYYENDNVIDLPLYHGYSKKNKNGTKKMIEYNQANQCIRPTNKRYWKKTKDKYNVEKKRFYWTRYMTWANRRHMFKNKVTLFIIINLKNLNICLKHQCSMTITICKKL